MGRRNWQYRRQQAELAREEKQKQFDQFIDENPPAHDENSGEYAEDWELNFGEYADFLSQPNLEEVVGIIEGEDITVPYELPEPPEVPQAVFNEDVDPKTDIETLNARIESLKDRLSKAAKENKELRQSIISARGAVTTANRRLQGRKDMETGMRCIDRLPPNSIDLEQAVLGAYILHPGWMGKFNQPYLNKMFYDLRHTEIHKSMMDLEGKLDVHSLGHHLRDRQALEAVGGFVYLDALMEGGQNVPSEEAVGNYISLLETLFLKREVIQAATQVVTELYEGSMEDGGEDKKKSRLHNPLGDDVGGDNRKPLPDMPSYIRLVTERLLEKLPLACRFNEGIDTITSQVLAEFNALVERSGRPLVSTGYPSLDRFTHGVRERRLVVLGARTKMGKTTFNVNLAYNLAQQNHGSLIFAFDTSRKEYVEKLIARDAGVDSEAFYWMSAEDQETPRRVRESAENIKKMPIWFDSRRPDIDSIVRSARQYKMLHPEIKLIVVDGMQSFDRYIKYQGRKEDIYYEVLKKLKGVAEDLRVTVLVNSQLKEQAARHKGKRPNSVEDFPDTQGLTELANVAAVLYRPEEYWPNNPELAGWVEVNPVALRVGSRAGKAAKLGIDMAKCHIYEFPPSDSSYEI